MDVSEAVYSRQSTRAFTDQKVSDELIKELLEKSVVYKNFYEKQIKRS